MTTTTSIDEAQGPANDAGKEAAESMARMLADAKRPPVPKYFGSQAETIARLDELYRQFGLEEWSESLASQDALYDFGGLPA